MRLCVCLYGSANPSSRLCGLCYACADVIVLAPRIYIVYCIDACFHNTATFNIPQFAPHAAPQDKTKESESLLPTHPSTPASRLRHSAPARLVQVLNPLIRGNLKLFEPLKFKTFSSCSNAQPPYAECARAAKICHGTHTSECECPLAYTHTHTVAKCVSACVLCARIPTKRYHMNTFNVDQTLAIITNYTLLHLCRFKR